jgi:hypothetical protein
MENFENEVDNNLESCGANNAMDMDTGDHVEQDETQTENHNNGNSKITLKEILEGKEHLWKEQNKYVHFGPISSIHL